MPSAPPVLVTSGGLGGSCWEVPVSPAPLSPRGLLAPSTGSPSSAGPASRKRPRAGQARDPEAFASVEFQRFNSAPGKWGWTAGSQGAGSLTSGGCSAPARAGDASGEQKGDVGSGSTAAPGLWHVLEQSLSSGQVALSPGEKFRALSLDCRWQFKLPPPASPRPWPGARLGTGPKRCGFVVVRSLPGQGGDKR